MLSTKPLLPFSICIIKTSECDHMYWWPTAHWYIHYLYTQLGGQDYISVELEFTEFVTTIFYYIPPVLPYFLSFLAHI